MPDRPLPLPDSDELASVVTVAELRRIYRVLYERRDDPPTRAEVEAALEEMTGEKHSQRGRRARDLYPIFDIQKTRERRPRYQLLGWATTPASARRPMSRRLRAEVLAPQRCAMCGRTPLDDGVRLVVDHVLPIDWGGSDDPDNLQPLCDDCNGGKKNLFSSFGGLDLIRAAALQDEPHRRIGQLLKQQVGTWMPGAVISAVASHGHYQEDWQKRTRELRTLGWKIEWRRQRNDQARTVTSYRVTKVGDWPEGNIAAEIRRRERLRRKSG